MNQSSSSSPLVARALGLKSPRLLLVLENCRAFSHLKAIHAHMLRAHLFADVFCASRLLAFCADPLPTNSPDDAAATGPTLMAYADRVFSQVERPNLFMHNALIRGWSAHGADPRRSLLLFRRLLRRALRPDNLTFPFVLRACAASTSALTGRQAHAQLLRRGFSADPFAQSSLLRMYARCDGDAAAALRVFREIPRPDVVILTAMSQAHSDCGDLVAARQMFDEMPERTAATWSCLVCGYAKKGRFKEALDLFRAMTSENVKANESAMVGVLASCAGLGALGEGLRAHEYMARHNIPLNRVLGTALVDMYAKCGDIGAALAAFERLPARDWLSWTTMIAGLAAHGRAGDALDLFAAMVRSGIAPRPITFTAALSACSHAGLVDRGLELFESMRRDHGLEPGREHYGCVVDLLGRAGRVEEAERLALGMPMAPDGSVWGAVLGACAIHRDSTAAGKLLAHLPADPGGHAVLASNILARAERWDLAAELRAAMRRRGVDKQPGQSALQTDD